MKYFSLPMLLLFLATPLLGQDKKSSSLPNFDKLWNYRKPGETEKKFRQLLPQAKKSGDLSYLAQLLTQIARTQGLQRKFKEAHQTLDQAGKLLTPKLPTANVRYLLERGRVYNSSGKKDKARPLFLKAYQYGKKHGLDRYTLDAAHMMGIVEPPKKQLAWNLKAIQVAEESKNPRVKGWLGPLYNNTGWSYHELKDYNKAMVMFKKSLAFRQKWKHQRETLIARWCIGRCYRSLGKNEKALKIQLELKEKWEKKGGKPGYVYEELGELYLIKKQPDMSKKFFAQAYEVLSQDKWLQANQKKRLERMKKLSQ